MAQPVTQSARSRRSYEKIEDSEQFYTKENNKINEKVIEKIKKQTSQFFLLVFIDDLCFLY